MANHMAKPSFVAGLLGSPDHSIPPGELDKIKLAASSLYGGGSDTTVAVLTVFFLAMTLSPEVQRKAHEVSDFHPVLFYIPEPKLNAIDAIFACRIFTYKARLIGTK